MHSEVPDDATTLTRGPACCSGYTAAAAAAAAAVTGAAAFWATLSAHEVLLDVRRSTCSTQDNNLCMPKISYSLYSV